MNRNINNKLEFTLQLKAVDFRNTEFNDCNKCAIEKAILRQLGTDNAFDGVTVVTIEDKDFKHDMYGIFLFEQDKIEAESFSNDMVIRELILTEV